MADGRRSEQAQKIKVSQDDFSTIEAAMIPCVTKLEGLFGLMCTSAAEISGGEEGGKLMLNQVGELGQMLTDHLFSELCALFEVQKAGTKAKPFTMKEVSNG